MPTVDLRNKKDEIKSLTVEELTKLKLSGWKEGQTIPPDLLESIRKDVRAKLPDFANQGSNTKVFKTFEELTPEEKLQLFESYKSKQDQAIPVNTPSAGGAEAAPNCPHCGWTLSDQEDPKPNDEDRLIFVQAVLGGTRFRKTYPFFTGEMSVTLRSLTTDEADLAFTQAAIDAKNINFTTESQYLRTLMDYRLAMSIETLRTPDGVVHIPETLSSEFETETPLKGSTKLMYIVPYIYEKVLRTEHMRRIVGSTFYRFQRLIEKLEASSDNANFWKAIEGANS